MAVAFDANATADTTANGVTSTSPANLTIGSGSNRALVVQLLLSLKTASAVTVTWDNGASNQACTLIVTANGGGATGRAELWGLVAPVSGAKTLRAAWTGSSDVVINGVSWTGVDQTGGATSFPHSTSTTGSGISGAGVGSITVTSAVGNAVMMNTAANSGNWSAPTQTATFTDNTPASMSTAGQRAAGAASVTASWTLSVAGSWVTVGTDILAAATTTMTPIPRPMQWVKRRRKPQHRRAA